jgi:hypothetical protein
MTDLVTRSGRCHGPDCHRTITEFDRSPDFCSEECQTHWHRLWTRGTAVTKGWVRYSPVHVGHRAPGDRTIYPIDPSGVAFPRCVCPLTQHRCGDCQGPVGCGVQLCAPCTLRAEQLKAALLRDHASAPAQPVHQTNRSWSERLTGWWRPNG